MNTKSPLITKGFPISVPLDEYYSCSCVYKILFGKKYFIWKGKALLQSCEGIAKQLKTPVVTKTLPARNSYLYLVIEHIIKTRCLGGSVTIIDHSKEPLELLKIEQKELDKAASDPDCLNNNEQAYVPASTHFISEADKEKFLQWYPVRKKKKTK